MSLIQCARCDSFIDTDYDDAGIYADNPPFEFICGECCEVLFDKSPDKGPIYVYREESCTRKHLA